MAQNDGKGQPPAPGGTAAPTAAGTPQSGEIYAPPSPEAPDPPAGPSAAEALPTTEGAPGTAGPGAADPSVAEALPATDGAPGAAGPGAGEQTPPGAATENETERLRREVREAEQALRTKKEALESHEAQAAAKEAAAAKVRDYAAEVAALQARERGLRQYQAAETSYLETMLPAPVRAAIAKVDEAPRRKTDDLRVKIEQDERDAADARRDLAEARAEAAAAKQASEALKRPGASIKERLSAADAIRADAKKASDSGNYALAYWLVRESGKLDQAMEADPKIIAPEALSAAIAAAAARQTQADKAVEDLENRAKTLDDSLQKDRAALATLQRAVEATILTELAKLNPPSAEAA